MTSAEGTPIISWEKRRLAAVAFLLGSVATAGCGGQKISAEPGPYMLNERIGYDVSYPQCGTELPKPISFAIVGVNGRLANLKNPCFEEQLAWARKHSRHTTDMLGKPAVYVHIANPGSRQASQWPDSSRNKYGDCRGDDSLACDYAYGEQLAKADAEMIQPEKTGDYMWWLDVEPNYSWQHDTARNRAAMEGMVAYFKDQGGEAGIYSSASIWQEIAGDVPADSELHKLPAWVLGAHTVAEAKANCRQPAFTGGPMMLAQIATNEGLDRDLVCTPYSAPQ